MNMARLSAIARSLNTHAPPIGFHIRSRERAVVRQ